MDDAITLYNKDRFSHMGFKWLEKELSRALKIAGNQDRYQYIVVSLLCCTFFFNIFLIVGTSIYYMDPVFKCGNSDQPYQQSYACDKLPECSVINNFTIVYKMQLYCTQQHKRTIGSLIGLIIMNVVSDFKGRKFALLADLLIAVASSLFTYLGAVVQSVSLLVLGSMLSGFSGYSLIVISYIMIGDICQESLRQKSSMYVNVCMSLGLAMFYFVYNWFNQWFTIVILFMFIPFSGIAVACYVFIEQSPNYNLFQVRDQAACIQSLMNIAKINKKNYVDCQRIKFIVKKIKAKLEQQKPGNSLSHALTALSKWKYIKIILCMCIVQAGGNLCFYGIQYAVNDIGYSFGVNNLLIGLTEIVATLAIGELVVNLPRKKTLSISYGCVPFLAFLFVFDFVSSSPLLCILIILAMRTMTTIGYLMIVMIQTESFPLEIQSIGAGSIEGLSQLGSFIAPFLNAFSINHRLPKITVMGFALMFCLIPLVFVPESSSITLRKQVKKPYSEQTRQIKSEAPKLESLL